MGVKKRSRLHVVVRRAAALVLDRDAGCVAANRYALARVVRSAAVGVGKPARSGGRMVDFVHSLAPVVERCKRMMRAKENAGHLQSGTLTR